MADPKYQEKWNTIMEGSTWELGRDLANAQPSEANALYSKEIEGKSQEEVENINMALYGFLQGNNQPVWDNPTIEKFERFEKLLNSGSLAEMVKDSTAFNTLLQNTIPETPVANHITEEDGVTHERGGILVRQGGAEVHIIPAMDAVSFGLHASDNLTPEQINQILMDNQLEIENAISPILVDYVRAMDDGAGLRDRAGEGDIEELETMRNFLKENVQENNTTPENVVHAMALEALHSPSTAMLIRHETAIRNTKGKTIKFEDKSSDGVEWSEHAAFEKKYKDSDLELVQGKDGEGGILGQVRESLNGIETARPEPTQQQKQPTSSGGSTNINPDNVIAKDSSEQIVLTAREESLKALKDNSHEKTAVVQARLKVLAHSDPAFKALDPNQIDGLHGKNTDTALKAYAEKYGVEIKIDPNDPSTRKAAMESVLKDMDHRMAHSKAFQNQMVKGLEALDNASGKHEKAAKESVLGELKYKNIEALKNAPDMNKHFAVAGGVDYDEYVLMRKAEPIQNLVAPIPERTPPQKQASLKATVEGAKLPDNALAGKGVADLEAPTSPVKTGPSPYSQRNLAFNSDTLPDDSKATGHGHLNHYYHEVYEVKRADGFDVSKGKYRNKDLDTSAYHQEQKDLNKTFGEEKRELNAAERERGQEPSDIRRKYEYEGNGHIITHPVLHISEGLNQLVLLRNEGGNFAAYDMRNITENVDGLCTLGFTDQTMEEFIELHKAAQSVNPDFDPSIGMIIPLRTRGANVDILVNNEDGEYRARVITQEFKNVDQNDPRNLTQNEKLLRQAAAQTPDYLRENKFKFSQIDEKMIDKIENEGFTSLDQDDPKTEKLENKIKEQQEKIKELFGEGNDKGYDVGEGKSVADFIRAEQAKGTSNEDIAKLKPFEDIKNAEKDFEKLEKHDERIKELQEKLAQQQQQEAPENEGKTSVPNTEKGPSKRGGGGLLKAAKIVSPI